jgi:hypothetical protein
MTATDSKRSSSRRPALAAAIAAALACAAASHVAAAPVDLQVIDRATGQPLHVWRRDGRLYVAGAVGDRYGLRVTNHTDGRVLVVMSVDGVNIISGETAGYDQRGYIFAPGESYQLDGWRKSTTEVADFTFSRQSGSYAALTGRPANVGVIGIAVFNERTQPVVTEQPPPELERGAADSAAARAMARNAPPAATERAVPAPPPPPPPPPAQPLAGAAGKAQDVTVTAQKRESPAQRVPMAITAYTGGRRDTAETRPREEKLGTGHGAREYSLVSFTPFERATPYPQFTQEIAYDSYANLVAMGVIPGVRYGERRPQPFPSSPARGFVPDPPNDP